MNCICSKDQESGVKKKEGDEEVEEEIPLEVRGGPGTNDGRSQQRALQEYVAKNQCRKRKINVLVGVTIVSIIIAMGLGMYIFIKQEVCPRSPTHQDLPTMPSLSEKSSPSIKWDNT